MVLIAHWHGHAGIARDNLHGVLGRVYLSKGREEGLVHEGIVLVLVGAGVGVNGTVGESVVVGIVVLIGRKRVVLLLAYVA